MTTSALRIANNNSQLQYFVIRDVLDWDHHDQLDDKCRLKQVGTYQLFVDDNAPSRRSLRIHETGVNQLSRHFIRSSTRELGPTVE